MIPARIVRISPPIQSKKMNCTYIRVEHLAENGETVFTYHVNKAEDNGLAADIGNSALSWIAFQPYGLKTTKVRHNGNEHEVYDVTFKRT